ncbi:hypothetical protein Tco_0504370, partial [Tanacetum coccineum]
RILKSTDLTSNTPYPARRYGVSVPGLHKLPRRFEGQYAVSRRSIRRKHVAVEEYYGIL